MANLVAISGKLLFKLDSGEVKDGKPVYRTVTVSDIDGSKAPAALSAAAEAIGGLIGLQTEQISLSRTDLLVP